MREEEKQRDDDQPAAHAEKRTEEAGDDADDCQPKHRSYRMAMDALARLRQAPQHAAVLRDVHGTLAPIVARPEDAAVPETTRAVLRDLVARYALVGAITGRPGALGAGLGGVGG